MRFRMQPMDVAGKSSLWGKVFSWSHGRVPQTSQVVAAMLGLAGPIAVGAMVGHPRIGMVISLGGLALSGDGKSETLREQAPGLLYSLVAGSAAVFTGSTMAGRGMPATFGIPAIAAAAGLLGGISRPMVRATTQFILYTTIAANLNSGEAHPLGTMLLFLLGAAWTSGLSLGLRPLFRAMRIQIPHAPENVAPSRIYSVRQLLSRWWKSLAHLSGWQYTLRITLCLVAAEAFDWIWPHHHGYWVSITVVIVVHRNLQAALTRALQRAAGTALGVLLISLLLLGTPPTWAIIAMIAVLAAARPILKETHYAAYAAVMTPLVILLLDFGQAPSWSPIVDRLFATLAGCTLALTLGYLIWPKLSSPGRMPVENKGNQDPV
jgi:hypothetical protein